MHSQYLHIKHIFVHSNYQYSDSLTSPCPRSWTYVRSRVMFLGWNIFGTQFVRSGIGHDDPARLRIRHVVVSVYLYHLTHTTVSLRLKNVGAPATNSSVVTITGAVTWPGKKDDVVKYITLQTLRLSSSLFLERYLLNIFSAMKL